MRGGVTVLYSNIISFLSLSLSLSLSEMNDDDCFFCVKYCLYIII